MLVAYNDKKELVYSYYVLKRAVRYSCPICHGEVIYRNGTQISPHFAHKKKGRCIEGSEAESKTHLEGKFDLYKILEKQTEICILEKYFPTIWQRADIYFYYKQKEYVIEFQCSSLSIKRLIERTCEYNKLDIFVIWIFNYDLLQKCSGHMWKLSLFIQSSQFYNNTIFTYDTEKKLFGSLYSIIPFSRRYFFANEWTISLANISPEFFLTGHYKKEPYFFQNWVAWRANACKRPIYNYNLRNSFYKKLYYLKLTLADLPLFVGVPLPCSWVLNTPVLEWQGSIFLELISFYNSKKNCKTYEVTISEQELWSIFRRLLKNRKLEVKEATAKFPEKLVSALKQYTDVMVFSQFLIADSNSVGYQIKLEAISLCRSENDLYSYIAELFKYKS